ncbi:hypothetical protein Pyn_02421 [Prunus yedoensis var. nudiflora]|uniref:Uncharacterized protein n=1 Tax=Prunus yedoensis var. nudiflora TaxID=2094558 RepID=A0A314UCT7_PRUYE|nr:hypothetical protein Pyn_02421 [Prunus yedoensis var. nudiflora]
MQFRSTYQSFCTPSQLANLGQGIAGGLRTPVAGQQRPKERVPTSSSQGVRVGTKKRSQPEEAGSGAKAKAQPKVAFSKRAKVSSVEAPRVAPVPVSPSPLVVPPPSTALSSAGSEGRIAEAGSSAEGAGPVPQVEEAQGRSTSEVDNRTKVWSE